MTDMTLAPALTFTRAIRATPAQLYRAFTDRDGLRDWLCDDAHLRAAVGGHVLFFWGDPYVAVGRYTALEQDKRVAFTWRGQDDAQEATVNVEITSEGDGAQVTVSFEGFAPEDEAELNEDWARALDNLKSIFETGSDRRISDRVLVGFTPGEFNEAVAKQLGVPFQDGAAKIDGVLPGLSAEAAGLQANDVIVAHNGKPLTPDYTIFHANRGRKPGEVVNITYYRGGEKHSVDVELKGYPVPPMPADYHALANTTEQLYARFNEELTALFSGVSEEQASKQSGENEWSAKQVIAHLILTEQWVQHWVGSLMQGPETSGFTANTPARIAGVMHIYPTTTALLDALRREWTHTVAILRNIPAEHQTYHNNLWWAAFEVDSFAQHYRGHVRQIKAALGK